MTTVSMLSYKNAGNPKNNFQGGKTMETNNFFDTYRYGEYPFAIMGIDKIAIGIDNRLLTCRDTPYHLIQKIDIITFGNYSILNLQGEFINSAFPLHSIALLLIEAVRLRIFTQPFGSTLMQQCAMFLSGWWHPSFFIEALFTNGPFKWDELEIYFDMYGETLPFQIHNRRMFINTNHTLYTKDYKMLYRNAENPDGSLYRQKKGVIRSIVALYDRGKRLDQKYPYIPHGPITRLEIRICDKKAKLLLNPHDLCLPLESFIDKNGNRIMNKIRKSPLPPDTIWFDSDFITYYLPYLPKTLDCTFQPGISSLKQQIFPEKRQ
jgi:hypothetical protein